MEAFGSREAINTAELLLESSAASTAVTRPSHCSRFPLFSTQEAVRAVFTLPCSSLGNAEILPAERESVSSAPEEEFFPHRLPGDHAGTGSHRAFHHLAGRGASSTVSGGPVLLPPYASAAFSLAFTALRCGTRSTSSDSFPLLETELYVF